MSKPREFWIYRLPDNEWKGSELTNVYANPNDLIKVQSTHVREVFPSYDEAVKGLVEALEACKKEMYEAACCIQVMKDGNDEDDNGWGRLRALRHSFFGKRDAGLKAREALASYCAWASGSSTKRDKNEGV